MVLASIKGKFLDDRVLFAVWRSEFAGDLHFLSRLNDNQIKVSVLNLPIYVNAARIGGKWMSIRPCASWPANARVRFPGAHFSTVPIEDWLAFDDLMAPLRIDNPGSAEINSVIGGR